MLTGILARIYRKSLGNQVAIAVGSGCSKPNCGIPELSLKIEREFGVSVSVDNPLYYFRCWNDLVRIAEERSSREAVLQLVADAVQNAVPAPLPRAVASVPISNFIDTTFDRLLLKALQDAGKKPILHDWHSQMIGSWKQSNPEQPNVFFSLPPVAGPPSAYGAYEPIRAHPQNQIQVENMREMLAEKDLLLIGVSPLEAEFILQLHALCLSFEKAYVDHSGSSAPRYWANRGVMICGINAEELIKRLIPGNGPKDSFLDAILPGRRLIEVTREKQYDAFISYFSGDRPFVKKLEEDLRLRQIHIWRDEQEIEIGDSMTEKIQQGLSDSYTFIIVLSPEALARPWVNEELRAAYAQRLVLTEK